MDAPNTTKLLPNLKKAQINLKIIEEKAESKAQINLIRVNSITDWEVVNLILLSN